MLKCIVNFAAPVDDAALDNVNAFQDTKCAAIDREDITSKAIQKNAA